MVTKEKTFVKSATALNTSMLFSIQRDVYAPAHSLTLTENGL